MHQVNFMIEISKKFLDARCPFLIPHQLDELWIDLPMTWMKVSYASINNHLPKQTIESFELLKITFFETCNISRKDGVII